MSSKVSKSNNLVPSVMIDESSHIAIMDKEGHGHRRTRSKEIYREKSSKKDHDREDYSNSSEKLHKHNERTQEISREMKKTKGERER